MQNPQTTVSFEGTRVLINGQLTYKDREQVKGLLFNLRTVNATFDDRKPKASVNEVNTLGKVSWWDDDGSHPENDYAGYG